MWNNHEQMYTIRDNILDISTHNLMSNAFLDKELLKILWLIV